MEFRNLLRLLLTLIKFKKSPTTSLKQLARISKKWLPVSKTLFLDTLDFNSKHVFDSSGNQTALGQYWASTFADRPIDTVRAEKYLSRFSIDFHFSELPPHYSLLY